MNIQSVDRAMKILSLFSYDRPRWGIAEIAKAINRPKGTVHNLVSTLCGAGFLQQDDETRRYALGPKIFALGSIMAGTLEINQKALGPVHKLAAQTDLVVRIAIWDRNAALVTLNVQPQFTETFSAQIGPRVVAYASAVGRVLLAYLPPDDLDTYLSHLKVEGFTPRTIGSKQQLKKELKEIRSRGIAINNQELSVGRASIAAAIFQKDGRIAAAISLTGQPDVVVGDRTTSLIKSLRETATEISRYMGFLGTSSLQGNMA